jgi:hypothetical protein
MVSLLRTPESSETSSIGSNSTASKRTMADLQSHDYTLAMQEYMDLQVQRDELSSYLDQIRPLSLSTSHSSTLSTPSSSPTRSSRSPSSRRGSAASGDSGRKRQRAHARCSGWDVRSETLDTIPDEETLYEISAEERRLFDVDEGIKRALTELLNCDSVRHDRSMRLWVQSRLMETEKQLRSCRRRRGS